MTPYLVIVSNKQNMAFAYGPYPDAIKANAWARREQSLGHIQPDWEIVPLLPIPEYPPLRRVA